MLIAASPSCSTVRPGSLEPTPTKRTAMADDTPKGPPRQRAYLLKSKLNPFPVMGDLELTDDRLRFTLGAMAGEAVLGWVEEALDTTNLTERLRGGESVVAFDLPRAGLDVAWPKQFMGSGLELTPPEGRSWLVTLTYPSGGLFTTYKTMRERPTFKAWKA